VTNLVTAGLKRLRSLNLGGCRQLTNNCLVLVTGLLINSALNLVLVLLRLC